MENNEDRLASRINYVRESRSASKPGRPLLSTGAAIALGLSAIIVAAIIVAGIVFTRSANLLQTLETLDINVTGEVDEYSGQGDMQVNVGINQESEAQQSSIDWEGIPKQDIIDTVVALRSGVVAEDGPVEFVDAVDLTGDGIPEGVYSLAGFNNNITAIFLETEDGYALARMIENADHPSYALLYEIGRVQHSTGYKLLPEIHGFYVVSKSLDQTIESPVTFVCQSLNVFQWDEQRNAFVMNNTTQSQYYAQECS